MTDINFKVDGNWTNAALAIYKVGAIYMSVDSTSPATLFGGTWVALEGRMLIGAGTAHIVGDTGGTETVTLTKEQSGLPAHGHGFTQPTVNGGSTSISSSGSHGHTMKFGGFGAGGTNCDIPSGGGKRNVTDVISAGNHTHSVPGHTHSVSGGAVSDNSGADATQAHDNMPPYLAVYMWKRTA